MKANYGPKGGEIRLRWDAGVYAEIPDDPGMIGALRKNNAEKVFLELVEAAGREGRQVSESKHASNFAPRLFAERPDAKGFSKRDFKQAI